jgi:hypothetical protein
MYQILFWKNIVTLVRQVLWLEKSSDDSYGWLQDKKIYSCFLFNSSKFSEHGLRGFSKTEQELNQAFQSHAIL